jgi:guanylate kinase
VDVIGGRNIKTEYGDRALSIFIAPPSIEELHRRLVGRATDSPEVIAYRVERATFEMTFRDVADVVIVNDNLDKAKAETLDTVQKFIN